MTARALQLVPPIDHHGDDVPDDQQDQERPQVSLWEYLHLLAAGLARKQIPANTQAVALQVALSGKGATGKRCVVDDQKLCADLGLGRSTVWRHVEWLTSHGWLVQVEKPTRAKNGRAGRKARYDITLPTIDLGIELPGNQEDES